MARTMVGVAAAVLVLGASAAAASGASPATLSAATAPATAPATQPATPVITTKPEPAPAMQVVSFDQVRARYEAALKAARGQYLRELTELKRRAMKAENLREANAIDEQIRQLSAERAPGSPLRTSGGTQVRVQANQDWQSSSVSVKKGDVLDVTARGQWVVNDRSAAETTYGPDGLRADGTADFHGQWAVLLARIGPKVYLVGKGTQIVAEQDGVLEFRSNDFSVGDNQGAITARVVKNE